MPGPPCPPTLAGRARGPRATQRPKEATAKAALVIGFEDTAEGRDAIALGGQIADALALKPLITRVIALPEGVLSSGELTAALEASAAGALAEPLEQLEALDPAGEALTGATAAHALHDLAEQRSATAIVVGSSDRGALGRLIPGSTAERLLCGSPCAVAVAARGYAADGTRPGRIAVAYDGSEEAARALDAGVALARHWKSKLTLLTVRQTISVAYTPVSALSAAELQAREDQRMRKILDAGRCRVPPDLPVRERFLRGPPGQALADVSGDFNLMLVGSRGYGPVRGTLLGSTSRRLFHASRCSVMALPRGVPSGSFTDQDAPGQEPGAKPKKEGHE